MELLWSTCQNLHLPLKSGASKEDLQRLEERWGQPLPATLTVLLQEHDGLDLAVWPADQFMPIRPLGTREIISALDQMDEVLESGEVQELSGLGLPVFEVDTGEFLVLFSDAALGERLALWPMLSEVVDLWFLNLPRFAVAWQNIQTNPQEFTYELFLDYPATSGPLDDDARVALDCLARADLERQAGNAARSRFCFDLALQLWPQERALEILSWPQVGEEPEAGWSLRERLQEIFEKRQLTHLLK